MDWAQVLADPCLQDLPYKIETNEYGQIVMSPASNRHGNQQVRIAMLMTGLRSDGVVQVECSIDTPLGVKVPDVVWKSNAFCAQHGEITPYPVAPEVCVEVVSPSNSSRETDQKRGLYFQRGAKEVWICNELGDVRFFTAAGEVGGSSEFGGFPAKI